jgi:two-component system, NtrC family, sensor kinase
MSLESRVIHIDDVLQDTEYTGSEFQRLAGFRTLLAVPLLREDTVIGSLLVNPLEGRTLY